jgi:hypothetical protein
MKKVVADGKKKRPVSKKKPPHPLVMMIMQTT